MTASLDMGPDDRTAIHFDPRLYAPATQRNRQPILDVLSRVLPTKGLVLEIASGTGEHAVWFAQHLRPLEWQPSDSDPDMRQSILSHAQDAHCPTLRPPIGLDVTATPWPIEQADAIVCINLIHIAPWAATEGLMRNGAGLLPPDGVLYLYGPFRRDGAHTAASNAHFDAALRAENPDWGVRDLEAVSAVAERHGLALSEVVEMPSNNLSVVFIKRDPGDADQSA